MKLNDDGEHEALTELEEISGFQNLFEIFAALSIALALKMSMFANAVKSAPVASTAAVEHKAKPLKPVATLYIDERGQLFDPTAASPHAIDDAELSQMAARHHDDIVLVQAVHAGDAAPLGVELLLKTMGRLQSANLTYALAPNVASRNSPQPSTP